MEFSWALFICIGIAAIAVGFIIFLFFRIRRQKVEDPKVKELQGYIKEGAMAFIKREYKMLAIFVIATAVLIGGFLSFDFIEDNLVSVGLSTAISFVIGAGFAALAGFIGMRVATDANGRCAQAAKDKGLKGALKVAFRGGSIMGLVVSALGIIGLSALILIFYTIYSGEVAVVITVITGFSLGISVIALFLRVGGGIYTKAADVGADLVGKIEKGLPEDDPRNPAVIADNVGDNVGDVAGMGADLFESYVVSIMATIALATMHLTWPIRFLGSIDNSVLILLILFPLLISAGGLIGSIIGILCVRGKNPSRSIKIGEYVAIAVSAAITLTLSFVMFNCWRPFTAVFLGNVIGIAIGQLTEYYTSDKYRHVKHIKEMSKTGAATNILSGLSDGMMSTAFPILLIVGAIIGSFFLGGMYGVGLAAVGMLATVSLTIAADAYGPIADNAGGLAEMAGLDKEVRKVTDTLDAVGNTTAATGKGFAIASAALTALALFVTFIASFNAILTAQTGEAFDITSYLNLSNPFLISGLLIGGMLPFVFSALTIRSVSKAANKMIDEVRRQFSENPEILEGTAKPDYNKCVDISTRAALREMIVPGILALVVPIVTGLLLGYVALAGLLAGALVTGVLMALFMSNSGGAWDNTKKSIHLDGGKNSESHDAAVIGDTVGDPLKDTSGPSLNTLVKLMTIVSVVLIPLFALIQDGQGVINLLVAVTG